MDDRNDLYGLSLDELADLAIGPAPTANPLPPGPDVLPVRIERRQGLTVEPIGNERSVIRFHPRDGERLDAYLDGDELVIFQQSRTGRSRLMVAGQTAVQLRLVLVPTAQREANRNGPG